MTAFRLSRPIALSLSAQSSLSGDATSVIGITIASGASTGDSNTAWNEWLLGLANAEAGGKLRIIANAGLASRTIAGALSSVGNNWNAADPGLAGLGSLGWVSAMIGTNDARGGASMSAQNQADWIAFKNAVLTVAQVMIVIAIPPVRATGGTQDVASFNTFYQAQCAADPTRLIWVDPWNVCRDGSGNWLSQYTPADVGEEKVHPGPAARALAASRAAELLSPWIAGLDLASPLVNSSADVYPTIAQTWPNPVMTGTGGTNSIGTGSAPTGLTVTRDGFPGSANSSIVAADVGDPNQTDWLKLDITEVAGASSALIVQAARSGASVTGSTPIQIDAAFEMRLVGVDTSAIESIWFRSYGVSNEEIAPPNALVLQDTGSQTRDLVYRTALRRPMAAAVSHASVTHQIRIESHAAASGTLGSIYLRRVGAMETA